MEGEGVLVWEEEEVLVWEGGFVGPGIGPSPSPYPLGDMDWIWGGGSGTKFQRGRFGRGGHPPGGGGRGPLGLHCLEGQRGVGIGRLGGSLLPPHQIDLRKCFYFQTIFVLMLSFVFF